MKKRPLTPKQLRLENEELRVRVDAAEETLRAIQSGEVDALLVGEQVFTLKGADHSYRLLIEQMNEGALNLTLEGVILYANRRFAEMVKSPLESIIGSSIQGWIASDDQTSFQMMLQRDSPQQRIEIDLRASDGNLIPTYLSISALHVEDASYIFSVVATDLTERKRAEQGLAKSENEFRSLAEAMPQIVWITLADGWNIYFNHQWMEYTGLTAEESYGHGWNIPFHPDDQGRAWDAWQNAVTNLDTYSVECRLLRKDGVYRWWLIRGIPVLDEDGKVLKWFGTCTDIEEIKRAQALIHQYAGTLEKRVEERTAELIRANRTKDEFLAAMSHELRTPLNSILGFSETLLDGVRGHLSERQRQAVELIYSGGEHLLGLINDVLDVSKIESGTFKLQLANVLVDNLCESSLNFIKQLANQKHITIEYVPPQPITLSLVADSTRLKQILVNLLNNAVKFTPEMGHVKLEVQADADAMLMRFSVTDTGLGIASQDQQKLFKPFVQLDSRLSRQYEGTGLGLALVQKLTDLHGGSVQVQSEVEHGSCFTVSLPWSKNIAAQQQQVGGIHLKPIIQQTFGGSIEPRAMPAERGVVLLADDNLPNILAVGDYLQNMGYLLIVAYDGAEALEKAQANQPDIIIMDIQMPRMDGLEAIQRLRAMPRFASTPIIALTALAMVGDRERCLEAGATEYLSKPVSLKTLRKMIETFLAVMIRPPSS